MIPTSWMLRIYGLLVVVGYSFFLRSPMMHGWMVVVKILVAALGSVCGLVLAHLVLKSGRQATKKNQNRTVAALALAAVGLAAILIWATLYFTKGSYGAGEIALYYAMIFVATGLTAGFGLLLARVAKWID